MSAWREWGPQGGEWGWVEVLSCQLGRCWGGGVGLELGELLWGGLGGGYGVENWGVTGEGIGGSQGEEWGFHSGGISEGGIMGGGSQR